jgi:hypothetical protein
MNNNQIAVLQKAILTGQFNMLKLEEEINSRVRDLKKEKQRQCWFFWRDNLKERQRKIKELENKYREIENQRLNHMNEYKKLIKCSK